MYALLKSGNNVIASEATLLNMLNIFPFSYNSIINLVDDSGLIFSPVFLAIKLVDLLVKFLASLPSVCLLVIQPLILP